MLNITKTTKYIAFAFLLAFVIPVTTFAGGKDNSGSYSLNDYGWSDWSSPSSGSYYYGSYSYDYTPDYSYGSSYYPSYSGSSYYPSYNSSSYPTYSGSSYSTPATSYSYSSSNPYTTSNSSSKSNSSSNSTATNNTSVTSTNTNNNNSSANATGGNANANATGGNAVNNNVNNVYVYTNPTGNAVLNNPAYQRLDGYCIITPSNPRVGQTVTATAYMTGGIGDYSYTWGGDLTSTATGVSTSFTSYTAGTKNITVTARSGQDVKTVNCNVTFQNDYYNGGNNGSLGAVCYPSATSVGSNQTVTWRVTPSGGNGYYSYSWSGSDGLYGNNSTVSKTYTYAGQKYATVNVTSNGQTISATCYTNVNAISAGTSVSGVYVQPQYINPGKPVSGVYLNDLPATGVSLTWMHYMIATMVLVLAGVATYLSKNKTRFTGVVDSE